MFLVPESIHALLYFMVAVNIKSLIEPSTSLISFFYILSKQHSHISTVFLWHLSDIVPCILTHIHRSISSPKQNFTNNSNINIYLK